jgi:purine-nucleoside phosphorylase
MSEVIVLKRRFSVGLICILTITTLLFAGCSKDSKGESKLKGVSNKEQTSTTSTSNSNSTTNKDEKSITDSDLINSAKEDSSVQLDSVDTESQMLSDEEMDLQLSNNELNNIPSSFNVK